MTTEQVKAQTKTVTRRFGWWFLIPGDVVWAVEKAMGLQKGEQIKRLCLIEIVSVRAEQLGAITADDCIKEGFPEMTPDQFIRMLSSHYGCRPDTTFNRIEFNYR